jgi:hypothetical protein
VGECWYYFLVDTWWLIFYLCFTQFCAQTQRSGQLSKACSIDMAPSFNLFNQSFDSFGDGHYFTVEGSLTNADSFGLGRTDSVGAEAAAQLLRKDSSTNFSTQFLNPSSSGAFTLGYSPVNSFGNASASPPRRNGEGILVVGGPDARASSPTEVLGMYTSGAAGANNSGSGKNSSNSNARPLEDSHLRMSVGSFGGHSMQSGVGGGGYNRSPYQHHHEASPPPPNYYSSLPPPPHEGSMVDSRLPLFYVLLRKYRRAFQDFTFLLPGVRAALLEDESNRDAGDKAAAAAEHKSGGGSSKGPAWDLSVCLVNPFNVFCRVFRHFSHILIHFDFSTDYVSAWSSPLLWSTRNVRRTISRRYESSASTDRIVRLCLWWKPAQGTIHVDQDRC